MKWYKFIIYVQLFLSALSGLVNGIKYITGSVYGDASERETIYGFFPSMKTVSTITGILMLAAAVVAIIARQKLAGFKHDGPMFYYITCGISIGASLIYCIAAYSELSKYSWLVDTSSYLAGSIVGILISVGLLICLPINICNISKNQGVTGSRKGSLSLLNDSGWIQLYGD